MWYGSQSFLSWGRVGSFTIAAIAIMRRIHPVRTGKGEHWTQEYATKAMPNAGRIFHGKRMESVKVPAIGEIQ